MNVLFHTSAAIGIAALLIEQPSKDLKGQIKWSAVAFLVALISHGVLDYIPHCYPLRAKPDFLLSVVIMISALLLIKKRYRIFLLATFFGTVFPDIVDLAPQILNKYLSLNLPISDKFFPWHLPQYSGSIFQGDCSVSTFYHLGVISLTVAILWIKRGTIKSTLVYL